ncbi:MAG TPA: S8 family peptidase [Xanthomonadaceae bacterium]|nr:S8 family peptidase [Xanthomonadaceae bacterium]
MKNTLLMSALSGAVLAALGLSQAAQAGGRSDLVLAALEAGRAQYNPGELLVQFRADAREQDVRAVRRGLGASRIEVVREDMDGRLELLKLPAGLSIADAVRALDGDHAVDFAEPNWAYFHQATSNDPYFTNGSLWGMYGDASSPANAFGSQAAEAWAANHYNCGTVWVGIIDEGYYYGHEDLAANAGKNPGEIAGNGVDDDGNGYVDDVYGWDFDGGNNTVFDGTSDDHGSHVAGTIGGVGGNSKGVAGVCWSVKLFNAKFLGKRGGTTANAIKAVDYMTDFKQRHGVNMVATNNSWGGGGFSEGLQNAIERANGAGILFVAAAGNDSYDCDTGSSCYPAEYSNSNVIAVASLTSSGAMSSFSSYGKNTVDICAPGSAIYSTVPKSSKGKVVSGYASYSGTSMAAPHVAGAAALYAAYHAGASASTIKSAILGSAAATSSCNGKVVSNGRLNVSGF